ncbi:Omega-scoloptoxin-Ssm2a [Bienertia sinuspersici]
MKCAGSRVAILLIAIAAIVVTWAAAGDENPEQVQQQQQLLWIDNILLGGARAMARGGIVADDRLSCIPSGKSCRWSFDESKDQCCPGSRCTGQGPLSGEFACEWCPGEGASCGALHSCCPRLRCVGGPFNGVCQKP